MLVVFKVLTFFELRWWPLSRSFSWTSLCFTREHLFLLWYALNSHFWNSLGHSLWVLPLSTQRDLAHSNLQWFQEYLPQSHQGSSRIITVQNKNCILISHGTKPLTWDCSCVNLSHVLEVTLTTGINMYQLVVYACIATPSTHEEFGWSQTRRIPGSKKGAP